MAILYTVGHDVKWRLKKIQFLVPPGDCDWSNTDVVAKELEFPIHIF